MFYRNSDFSIAERTGTSQKEPSQILTQLKVYKFKPKFSLLYITYVHKHKFKHNFMTAQELS